ncbi:GIN domain-containing protein [Microbulbifer sp.]|uniref:GIN domain-containing protein n=1 Tax=Microbulbifer sp. TaxID=1908541 RepID=UPI002F95CDAA
MSIFSALLLLVLGTSAVQAQDSSKTFPLDSFSAIALKGSSDLKVVQGNTFSVTAHGEEKYLPYARAEVDGDGNLSLWVEADSKSLFGVVTVSTEPEIEFRVTLPVVNAIRVTGSGDAQADTLESEKLELRVTGSGMIKVDKVAAEALSTGVTGSGDLILGTVLAVHGSAGITGSGDIRMDNFIGEDFSAQIKGSGDMAIGGKVANLNVTVMGSGDFMGRGLSATNAGGAIMGSGDIVLKRPANESFSVMGSGDIALVE